MLRRLCGQKTGAEIGSRQLTERVLVGRYEYRGGIRVWLTLLDPTGGVSGAPLALTSQNKCSQMTRRHAALMS